MGHACHCSLASTTHVCCCCMLRTCTLSLHLRTAFSFFIHSALFFFTICMIFAQCEYGKNAPRGGERKERTGLLCGLMDPRLSQGLSNAVSRTRLSRIPDDNIDNPPQTVEIESPFLRLARALLHLPVAVYTPHQSGPFFVLLSWHHRQVLFCDKNSAKHFYSS